MNSLIVDVLIKKREELLAKGDPLAVGFDVCEINLLSDPDRLRTLKLTVPFPSGYVPSSDLFSCADEVIRTDSLYKVLEFCVLRNRVLRSSVFKVFPYLEEVSDDPVRTGIGRP